MAEAVCNLDFLGGFVFRTECMNFYIAKLLGVAILAGAVALKLPQILNIIVSKNVDGLSEIAFYSEVPMCITTVVYNIRQGNPFTSYGETCAILIQNIILVFLLWAYMKPAPAIQMKALVVLGSILVGIACYTMQPNLLYIIPLSNLPMMVWARSAQIMTNFQRGSTGQLSLITNLLQFAGTIARVFTTIQEVGWDWSLLSVLIISTTLTGILLGQIIVYAYILKRSPKVVKAPAAAAAAEPTDDKKKVAEAKADKKGAAEKPAEKAAEKTPKKSKAAKKTD